MTKEADEPAITNEQELFDALFWRFLSNADTGQNEANDELIREWNEWKRDHQR